VGEGGGGAGEGRTNEVAPVMPSRWIGDAAAAAATARSGSLLIHYKAAIISRHVKYE